MSISKPLFQVRLEALCGVMDKQLALLYNPATGIKILKAMIPQQDRRIPVGGGSSSGKSSCVRYSSRVAITLTSIQGSGLGKNVTGSKPSLRRKRSSSALRNTFLRTPIVSVTQRKWSACPNHRNSRVPIDPAHHREFRVGTKQVLPNFGFFQPSMADRLPGYKHLTWHNTQGSITAPRKR
jgi:hypothetical protein